MLLLKALEINNLHMAFGTSLWYCQKLHNLAFDTYSCPKPPPWCMFCAHTWEDLCCTTCEIFNCLCSSPRKQNSFPFKNNTARSNPLGVSIVNWPDSHRASSSSFITISSCLGTPTPSERSFLRTLSSVLWKCESGDLPCPKSLGKQGWGCACAEELPSSTGKDSMEVPLCFLVSATHTDNHAFTKKALV